MVLPNQNTVLTIFLCCNFWLSTIAQNNVLQWQRIIPSSSVAPSGRRDSSIGFDSTRNRIVIFGGRSGSAQYADTWIFDIASRTWSKANDTTVGGKQIPEKRFTIVFGSWNDAFYISTGEGKSSSGSREFYNDVYRFNYATQVWQKLNPTAGTVPEKRYGASGGVHPDGDGLFLSHGFSGTRYANTFKFEFKNNRWITLKDDISKYNPNGPHQRCLQSGTMLSATEMIMYGGCLSGGKTGGPCPSQDSWVFDSSKKEWKELKTCASPRIYSAMAMFPVGSDGNRNHTMAVLYGGGETNNEVLEITKAAKDEVMIYDPRLNTWERKKVEMVTRFGTVALPKAEGQSVFTDKESRSVAHAEVILENGDLKQMLDPMYGYPELRLGHVMATTNNGIMMFGGAPTSGGGPFNDLWLLRGTALSAMNSKSAGKCNGRFFNLIALHGIFMFIGWGVFIQFGAFIARYFRHKDPQWFRIHRLFMSIGLLLAIAGLVCGIVSVRFDHFTFAHGIIGLDMMIAGLYQPLNAFFRPHKPANGEKKSKWRIVWEWCHKLTGRLALILAFINISFGLFLAVASNVVWGLWFAYMSLFIVIYIIAEIRMRIKEKKQSNSIEMDHRS